MTMVTFLSDRFSSTPPVDSVHGVLGEDLAQWLRGGLERRGFDVGGVSVSEYGYGFRVTVDQSHYWIVAEEYEPAVGPGNALTRLSVAGALPNPAHGQQPDCHCAGGPRHAGERSPHQRDRVVGAGGRPGRPQRRAGMRGQSQPANSRSVNMTS
jgi:hypothetical protein